MATKNTDTAQHDALELALDVSVLDRLDRLFAIGRQMADVLCTTIPDGAAGVDRALTLARLLQVYDKQALPKRIYAGIAMALMPDEF